MSSNNPRSPIITEETTRDLYGSLRGLGASEASVGAIMGLTFLASTLVDSIVMAVAGADGGSKSEVIGDLARIEALHDTWVTAITNTAIAMEGAVSEGEGTKAGVGCAPVFDVFRQTLRRLADQ